MKRKEATRQGLERFRQRRMSEEMADGLTKAFGTLWFFIFNAAFFVVWIIVNLHVVPWIPAFDPYPFNFLTMFVSLEAIFLSIIVLISQNSAAKVADMREEIDFRVNVQAEKEITKILRMLDAVSHSMNLPKHADPELRAMKRMLNIERIAEQVVKDLGGKA